MPSDLNVSPQLRRSCAELSDHVCVCVCAMLFQFLNFLVFWTQKRWTKGPKHTTDTQNARPHPTTPRFLKLNFFSFHISHISVKWFCYRLHSYYNFLFVPPLHCSCSLSRHLFSIQQFCLQKDLIIYFTYHEESNFLIIFVSDTNYI